MSLTSIEQALTWYMKGYGYDEVQKLARGNWMIVKFCHEETTQQWIEIKLTNQIDEVIAANITYNKFDQVGSSDSSRRYHESFDELHFTFVVPNSIYSNRCNVKEQIKYIIFRSIIMPLFPPKRPNALSLIKLPEKIHYQIAQFLQFPDFQSYFSSNSVLHKYFLRNSACGEFWQYIIHRDFPNRKLMTSTHANNHPEDYTTYKHHYYGLIGQHHQQISNNTASSSSFSSPLLSPRSLIDGEHSGGTDEENTAASTSSFLVEVRHKSRIWDWYKVHMNHTTPVTSSNSVLNSTDEDDATVNFATKQKPSLSGAIPPPITTTFINNHNNNLLRRSYSSLQNIFSFNSNNNNHNNNHHHHEAIIVAVSPAATSSSSSLTSPIQHQHQQQEEREDEVLDELCWPPTRIR